MIKNLIWRETVISAFKDFQSFKGRNILALVGIVIGTAAVIAILHVGHNARTEAVKQFEKLGTDVLGVMLISNNFEQSIPETEVLKIPKEIPNVSQVAAIRNTSGQLRLGRESISGPVYAVTEDFFDLSSAKLSGGRFLYDIDNYAPYAVIGNDVALSIERFNEKPIYAGQLLNLNGETFEIVGVLKDIPQNNVLRTELNKAVIIPYKAGRRIGATRLSGIAVRMIDNKKDKETTANITNWVKSKDNETIAIVQSASTIIANIDAQLKIYAFLLLGIGSISLLVSGVGIMNVMLISVLERRHEIGLRRAVGASQTDIIVLFLSNALLLCFIGSFLGLILGTLSAFVFAMFTGWMFSPSIFAIPLGILLAVIVGLFFGIYPAFRASKLDIVNALRSE